MEVKKAVRQGQGGPRDNRDGGGGRGDKDSGLNTDTTKIFVGGLHPDAVETGE